MGQVHSNVSPEDILAFILTGDWHGEDYELNPEQVARTKSVIEKLALSRMASVMEIPPADPDDLRIDKED